MIKLCTVDANKMKWRVGGSVLCIWWLLISELNVTEMQALKSSMLGVMLSICILSLLCVFYHSLIVWQKYEILLTENLYTVETVRHLPLITSCGSIAIDNHIQAYIDTLINWKWTYKR